MMAERMFGSMVLPSLGARKSQPGTLSIRKRINCTETALFRVKFANVTNFFILHGWAWRV